MAEVAAVGLLTSYQAFTGVSFSHTLLTFEERKGHELEEGLRKRVLDVFRVIILSLVLSHRDHSDKLENMLYRMGLEPSVHGDVLESSVAQYTTTKAPFR